MTCIELCVIGQKLSITLKSKDLAILAFKKNQEHPPKLAEVKPSFRKQPTPCKITYAYAFPRSPLG